jgi:hypothetical protein
VHPGTSDPLFKLEGGKFVGDICFKLFFNSNLN